MGRLSTGLRGADWSGGSRRLAGVAMGLSVLAARGTTNAAHAPAPASTG
jgi:hypothetical protein